MGAVLDAVKPWQPNALAGGPAFPFKQRNTDGSTFTSAGISAHDYFMAHAPFPPPKWFNPTMRDCPAVPSLRKLQKTDPDLAEAIERQGLVDSWAPELQARIDAWLAERAVAMEQQKTWQEELRAECWLQWPRFYADQQLARRV